LNNLASPDFAFADIAIAETVINMMTFKYFISVLGELTVNIVYALIT
jgi:hypothetical protein